MFLFFSFAFAGAPSAEYSNIEINLLHDMRKSNIEARHVRERILYPHPGLFRIVLENETLIQDSHVKVFSILGTVELVLDNRVQMIVDQEGIRQLSGLSGVKRIRRPEVPTIKSKSEGLAPMGVPPWHDAGHTGKGVSIGVLDVEFHNWDTYAGTSLPVLDEDHVRWAPSMGGPGDGVHGTGCAEIIHEIAPESDLYYANFGTELEYESQLLWLQDKVDIISASVGWDNRYPMDGSSDLAQLVEGQWDTGNLYIGAAGNEQTQYWTGDWTDTDGDGNMDFELGFSQNTIPLVYNVYGSDWEFYAFANLRWLEGFGEASIDLDMTLYTALIETPTEVIEIISESRNAQDGSGDPVESVEGWVNLPDGHGVFARVNVYEGDPTNMKLKIFNGVDGFFDELALYSIPEGSLTAPSDAEHCMAVGAVQHDDFAIASYSSVGPTDDNRSKPDIFAISHVTTDSYGPFYSNDEPGFNGTSAATPHIAGLAGLLWASSETSTNLQVWEALMDSVDTSMITQGDTAGTGLAVLGRPLDVIVSEPTAEPTAEPTTEPGSQPTTEPQDNTKSGCTHSPFPKETLLLLPFLILSLRRKHPLDLSV